MANFQTRYDVLPYGNFIYYSDTIPSSCSTGLTFRAGDICYNSAPTVQSAAWWFCTTSGKDSASVWRAVYVDQNQANFRNMLDGGDFTINPWQRNATSLASGSYILANITSTATYFPDRWFAQGGASSAIQLSMQSNTSIPGFANSCRFQRASGNSNTAVIYFGQVLESADCIRCQGLPVTLSFWAAAGSGFSGGTLTVQLVTSTGTNQTAANLTAGNWTATANLINVNQALTTTMTRYQYTATVGAAITQLGVLFSYTPSSTAAGANDFVDFMGIQLEIGPQATNFEHRDIQVELEICQRYAWVTPEPTGSANGGVMVGVGGTPLAANTQIFYMATPVQMRSNPNVSTATGSFSVLRGSTTSAAAALTIGQTHTVNAITVTGGATQAIAQPSALVGGGGTGYIIASADF